MKKMGVNKNNKKLSINNSCEKKEKEAKNLTSKFTI